MLEQVVSKRYNPYTGKWEDIYGPVTSSGDGGGGGGSVAPKTEASKPKPKTPEKPVTPDKKNVHQGTAPDNKKEAEEKVREFEYDLEGSAEIHPDPKFATKLTARDIVVFEGMGDNFSGKYFLATVVHTINRSGYSMSFDVLRNNFEWKSADVPPAPQEPAPEPVQPKQEPAKKAEQSYTVKKGDTLWAIAKRYYGNGADYTKIVEANKGKIKDPDLIYPNQTFVIP